MVLYCMYVSLLTCTESLLPSNLIESTFGPHSTSNDASTVYTVANVTDREYCSIYFFLLLLISYCTRIYKQCVVAWGRFVSHCVLTKYLLPCRLLSKAAQRRPNDQKKNVSLTCWTQSMIYIYINSDKLSLSGLCGLIRFDWWWPNHHQLRLAHRRMQSHVFQTHPCPLQVRQKPEQN